ENDRQRLLVRHPPGKVGRETVKIGGDAALTDALGYRTALRLQFAGRVVAEERRAERVGQCDLDRLVLFLQPDADAGQRAAGADGRDEAVHLAAGLGPDFLRRRADMTVPVG